MKVLPFPTKAKIVEKHNDDFVARMTRIKEALEKINLMMANLKNGVNK